MRMKRHPLITQLQRLATDRWSRRALRTVLQAASVAVGVWCAGLGAGLLWGWIIDLRLLTALSLAILGIALATLLRRPLRPAEVARRLDRRFHLNEQLATSVEVLATGAPLSPVVARLIDRSARTAMSVHQHVRQRQAAPWTDLFTLLALVIVAAGLFLLSGTGGLRLDAGAVTLPPLVQPLDPAQPLSAGIPPVLAGDDQVAPLTGTAESESPGSTGNAAGAQPAQSAVSSTAGLDPQTLEALADALRDQGATRPAADALDRGDTAAAARNLRELADQADSLSEQARQALAEALRDAARDIERRNPSLASQLRQSARDLERENSAARGLDELAQAIDQSGAAAATAPPADGPAGESPQNGQQGDLPGQAGADGAQPGAGEQTGQGSSAGNNPAGEQRPIAPAGRLGVEGQPVALDAQGGGQPAGTENNPATTLPGGSGSTSGGSAGTGGAIGADPLRIPLDERDVVQGYFQP